MVIRDVLFILLASAIGFSEARADVDSPKKFCLIANASGTAGSTIIPVPNSTDFKGCMDLSQCSRTDFDSDQKDQCNTSVTWKAYCLQKNNRLALIKENGNRTGAEDECGWK